MKIIFAVALFVLAMSLLFADWKKYNNNEVITLEKSKYECTIIQMPGEVCTQYSLIDSLEKEYYVTIPASELKSSK